MRVHRRVWQRREGGRVQTAGPIQNHHKPSTTCNKYSIFTGRNEVLAKVIFSQACVILSTGGGVPDQTPPPGTRQIPPLGPYPPGPGRYPPLGTRHHPEPGRYPSGTRHPPDQTPPSGTRHPPGPGRYPPGPGRYPPGTRHPPMEPDTPLWDQTPPPGTADYGIRLTFGRYASCWNAFLLHYINAKRNSFTLIFLVTDHDSPEGKFQPSRGST